MCMYFVLSDSGILYAKDSYGLFHKYLIQSIILSFLLIEFFFVIHHKFIYFREMAEDSLFRDLLEILIKASNEIEQACKDSSELLDLDTCLVLTAECFRCLRNACVQCAKNQHVMRYSFDPF